MNRPLRSLWLEMLRSGAYAQTRGKLQRSQAEVVTSPVAGPPVGYCCLGVLCEAVEKAGLTRVGRWPDGTLQGVSLLSQGLISIEDSLGIIPSSDLRNSRHAAELLMDMNDSRRKTFAEIADWIEHNIPADDATEFAL